MQQGTIWKHNTRWWLIWVNLANSASSCWTWELIDSSWQVFFFSIHYFLYLCDRLWPSLTIFLLSRINYQGMDDIIYGLTSYVIIMGLKKIIFLNQLRKYSWLLKYWRLLVSAFPWVVVRALVCDCASGIYVLFESPPLACQ